MDARVVKRDFHRLFNVVVVVVGSAAMRGTFAFVACVMSQFAGF